MKRVLPAIVISQFFCTSLWFAGNAVMPDIAQRYNLGPAYLAHLSSTVQFGFITGALLFAILGIPDRFSPSKVFFASAVIAAALNLVIPFNQVSLPVLFALRFGTGFFLAGIYPVGMKIAADHYREGLGKSLGFLVGALVLGTAFPHLIKAMSAGLPWKWVIFSTSALSLLGGLFILLFVPDGPYRKPGQKPSLTAFLKGFNNHEFRAASLGYFGHMWELYTFWVFVPVLLTAYKNHNPGAHFNISLLAFMIIASGSVACIISGLVSKNMGAKRVAGAALAISCACCILSPLLLFNSPAFLFIVFLFIWGMAVIADSPLFSTLVAQNAPEQLKGASLTIVNCLGFTITIISVQLINALQNQIDNRFIYMLLGIGPVLGLIALRSRSKNRQ